MVRASERGISGIEFLKLLREIEVYFVRLGSKKPKKFRTLFTEELIKLSANAYNCAKAGNSIYVSTDLDYQLRRKYMYSAYCNIQMLISQVEVWYEVYASDLFSNAELKQIAVKMDSSAKMIKKLMDSDKKRYKETK